MGAFAVKELRELLWAALPIAIAAVVLGWLFQFEPRSLSYLVLAFGIGTGFLVGVMQGVLDRMRRDDPFLLHRQVSWVAQHTARTAAGFALVLLLVEVHVVSIWLIPGQPIPAAAALAYGSPAGVPMFHPGLGTDGTLVTLSAALLTWATVRLSVSTRSKLGAVLLLCTLPIAVVLWVLRLDLEAVPVLAVGAALAVCCTLSVLNLSRPAV